MVKKLDELKIANRVVLDSDKVRITEISLKPGEKAGMHDHPNDYAVYALGETRFIQSSPDGKTGELSLKAGQAGMMKAGPHEVTNVGNNVARNLIIELK